MKDFKEMESIELKDFGVRVNPYLTYAQGKRESRFAPMYIDAQSFKFGSN